VTRSLRGLPSLARFCMLSRSIMDLQKKNADDANLVFLDNHSFIRLQKLGLTVHVLPESKSFVIEVFDVKRSKKFA
jgi:hypothetical protein